MSSPEIKRVPAGSCETSLAGTISTISGAQRNGISVLDPGEILCSRFDSLRLVSARGRAAFYVGRDLGANRAEELVAVKAFTGQPGRQLELFRLEACTSARLSHPNIIKANPPEEIDGVHFSIIEHRSGAETLRDLLNREGWLDAGSAIRITRQIADALDYASGLGVVHLGIRPETVLIDGDGTVLLTDFGLEALNELSWAHLERSGECPVQYISPEQAGGATPDSRSDLYSLGVVLYQMLTDRLPIDSEDPDSIRQRLVTHSPLAPHLYCADIPLQVSAVVTRLLERDPDMRFQDAASLRTTLDACAGQFIIDGPESEDAMQGVEADSHEEADCPLDWNALITVQARQTWETPSITVVNPPADEMSYFVSQSDSGPADTELLKPNQEQAEPELIDGQSGVANSLDPSSEWRRGPMVAPLILGLILALTAITGIIVLARADRAMAENPPAVESPAVERGGGDAGSGRTARPSPDEGSPAQKTEQQPERAAPGEGAANPASSEVRSRRLAIARPRVTPRHRRASRRSWRFSGYWRNYPYRRAR